MFCLRNEKKSRFEISNYLFLATVLTVWDVKVIGHGINFTVDDHF